MKQLIRIGNKEFQIAQLIMSTQLHTAQMIEVELTSVCHWDKNSLFCYPIRHYSHYCTSHINIIQNIQVID